MCHGYSNEERCVYSFGSTKNQTRSFKYGYAEVNAFAKEFPVQILLLIGYNSC